MSLALQKTLTTSNIKNGFKPCGIWPLNYDAMHGKMGLAKIFTAEVPLEVQVEEILEQGGLPTRVEEGTTHYYVDVEASSSQEQSYLVDVDGEEDLQKPLAPEDPTNINQFLRLPQEPPSRSNARHEPLVDYSQSHVLTSNKHVETLKRISRNKETIAKEKAEKAKTKEATKRKRAQEKDMKKAAKDKRAKERDMARKEFFFEKEQNKAFRAADAESEKRNKEVWTQEVLEEYGNNLQRLMKEWDKEIPPYIDTTLWQCRRNQRIAKARLEAKKAKKRRLSYT